MSKYIKSESVKFKVSYVAYALIAAVAASASLTAKAADPLYWTGGEKATSTEESPYDIWNDANWGGEGNTSNYDLFLSVTERTYIHSTNGTARVGSSLCPCSGEFVFTGPLLNYALKAGNVTNSVVSIKKSGDWKFSANSGAYISCATNSTVVFTNESGYVDASAGPGEIGPGASSYAKVVNLSGNWVFKNNLVLAGGTGSTGIVENVSGNWSVGGDMRVASSGYGEFIQYGGSLNVGGNMYIRYWGSGNGVLTIKGGTVTVASDKIVQVNNGFGTINLDGGTLVAPRVERRDNSGGEATILYVNFNGGTLKANADSTDFIHSQGSLAKVNVGVNGGVIDCGGHAVTLAVGDGIKGTGGLTFTGGNTITISNNVTYAGATRVTPGTTLAVANETAKNNILANGLVVAGVPTAGQTVFTYINALDNADLTNVSCPCAPETTFKFSDEGKTNIVVDVVGSPDWTKYSHKFKVSFSGYAGSETLTDFPVLVKISESGISGFRYADCKKPGGADLRFADADGNLLASEVDTWNTSGESLVWVKVPSLTAATKITAYYGWDLAPVVDSKAVWTGNGYVGVWHLNELGLPLAESSGFSSPFTEGEKPLYVDYGAGGIIGKSVDFGSYTNYYYGNSRLHAADDDGHLSGFTDFTVECWTYQTKYWTDGVDASMVSKGEGVINRSWKVYQQKTTLTTGLESTEVTATSTNRLWATSDQGVKTGEWMHQTFVRNKTGLKKCLVYHNGENVKSVDDTRSSIFSNTTPLILGGGGTGGTARVFPGSIDEVRISNVARSADGVKAAHDTVTESSFAKYGSARKNVDKGMIIILK